MKKFLAVLLLVAFLATSVFAIPVDGNFAFELDEDSSVTELTELETEEVEGEGGPVCTIVSKACQYCALGCEAIALSRKSEKAAKVWGYVGIGFGVAAVVADSLPW